MGIDTAIRKEVLAKWPGCQYDGKPYLNRSKKKGVIVHDVAVSVRGCIGPHRKDPSMHYQFSGREFFEYIFAFCKDAFHDEKQNIGTYVYCVDIPELIPKEKDREKKQRADNHAKYGREAAKERYGPDLVVSHDGVGPADGPFERFDIDRMAHTPYLKKLLWRYVHMQLLEEALPMGVCVILDYDAAGPLIINDDVSNITPSHRHGLGEGELMAVYWAHIFNDHPAIIFTTDTDIMPISMGYLSLVHGLRQEPLYWVWDKETHMDLMQLHYNMRNGGNWCAYIFLVAVTLCGTDYVLKKPLFQQIGYDAVFSTVEDLVNADRSHVHGIFNSANQFLRLVTRVYRNVLVKKHESRLRTPAAKEDLRRVDSIEEIRKKVADMSLSQYAVPHMSDLRHTFEMFHFNAWYWFRYWPAWTTGLRLEEEPLSWNGVGHLREWREAKLTDKEYDEAFKKLTGIFPDENYTGLKRTWSRSSGNGNGNGNGNGKSKVRK